MPTLLTNPRMHPALAARVEASVTGKKVTPGAPRNRPRMVMLMRVGVVVLVAFVVQSVVGFKKKEREDVTRTRSEVLTSVRTHSAGLTDEDRAQPKKIEALLVKVSRSFEREVVSADLKTKAGFEAIFTRPLLYVRGPLGNFATPAAIAEAAATSGKDALTLCLLDPPASRSEKDVLSKVRVAYGTGAALEAQTSNMRRLGEAQAGLPFLAPEYAKKVEASSDIVDLTKWKKEIDRAPLAAANRAAKARLLLVAMDEPGDGSPAELDGERRHQVRVALIDLTTETTLLDVRKVVDPSWISQARRNEMARGMDSCVLALDIRETAIAPAK